MACGLDVRAFGADEFYRALTNQRFTEEMVQQHQQAIYLKKYVEFIGAKTMVVEPKYVDKDYLADFASFYVSCFEPYDRFCKRIHFFSSEFDDGFLRKVILGSSSAVDMEELRTSYLGFVVARPLPQAIIGRTLLATYPSDNGRRNYKAIMASRVRLFGIDLPIKSLAFQEQDTAVAACATVSIWSALQRTADIYGTRAPQPPEITRFATQSLLFSRAVPSSGLHLEQMLFAIREAGLDPELYEPRSGNVLRPVASLIYGYCRAGLPVILVGELLGMGGHAVTIAGYSLRPTLVTQRELPSRIGSSQADAVPIPEPLALIGRRIDELYAHDDAIGPFSRLRIERPDPTAFDCKQLHWKTRFISDDWNKLKEQTVPFVPIGFIIPIYPKIRLRYDDVLTWIARVNALMITCSSGDPASVEWDIHLSDTNTYKSELVTLALEEERKFGLRISSQPRFIWRATFTRSGLRIAEFLLDATSFAKAFPVFAVNWFDPAAAERARAVIETRTVTKQLTKHFADLILLEIEQRNSSKIGSSSVDGS
jgi:hypothetical protein